MRLRRIFDDYRATLARHRADVVHRGRLTVEVHGKNRPRTVHARRTAQRLRIEREGVGVDVDQQRACADVADGLGRRQR